MSDSGGSSSGTVSGSWIAAFQGRTITLNFSDGTGVDPIGYRIDGVSGTLWNGQPFSGGRWSSGRDMAGRTTIGIMVPADSHLAQGLGTFIDDSNLDLGWYDSTYGAYCGELHFTRQ